MIYFWFLLKMIFSIFLILLVCDGCFSFFESSIRLDRFLSAVIVCVYILIIIFIWI